MDTNKTNLEELYKSISNKVKENVLTFTRMYSRIRWKKVQFVIPTKPEPSHRPRLSGYRVYVPGAAKNQSFFNKNVLPTLNGLFITTPCKIKVDIYCQTPRSFSNTQKCLAEAKLLRPWSNTGDVDNFLKSVLDQLQPNEKRGHVGIMANDCLVIGSSAEKYYSVTPRYEVTITYMSNIPTDLAAVMKMKNM